MQASITYGKFERWNCIQSRHLLCGRTGNSNCQVFFVRRSQQAKLGVCCSGPEGRNTAHFLALDDRIKERENLACPCCSFELHAMKTSVWMMKFRALFHVRNLAVHIGSHSFKLLTALAPCSFGFSRFGKIGQPHPSTPASLMFFPEFEKSQMRGRIENRCVDRV